MKKLIVLLVIGLFAVGVFAGPGMWKLPSEGEDITINSGPGMWKLPSEGEDITINSGPGMWKLPSEGEEICP